MEMKSSIKRCIRVFSIGMVVIVYITTIILSNHILDTKNILALPNIIVFLLFIILTYIMSGFVSKLITFPLKKIEKGMRSVAEGKVPDTKHLREYGDLREINDTIEAYSSMMRLIKKNNFDLNSQQSKTEIILEHMADGVVAFSIAKQVVHMNKAAMRLLNLKSSDDTFQKILAKLKIEFDFDKIMYLPNYTTFEIKTNVDDNDLNIVFVPFFSDRLTPMGVIMMVQNITETVRLDNMRRNLLPMYPMN